jgi:hypothetical protein
MVAVIATRTMTNIRVSTPCAIAATEARGEGQVRK